MDPCDLEASLLLKAAAKLQAVLEAWDQKPPSALADALLYDRRLWIVFIECRDARRQQAADRAMPERAEFGHVRDGRDLFSHDRAESETLGNSYSDQLRHRRRAYDGVNFTKAGAEKLGHYVEHELRRVLSSPVNLQSLSDNKT
jgi:hypothetical protein